MLAYELFLNNKDSSTSNVKKQIPIKKIFYKNNQITLDSKTMKEYGSETTDNTKLLQDWLQMPLNTTSDDSLNLPDNRTGTNALNPYIVIKGKLEIKEQKSKFILLIGSESNYIKHVLDLTNDEIQNKSNKKIKLHLDEEKYLLDSNPLFHEYVDSGIIDKAGILNLKVYDDVIERFFEEAKKHKPNVSNHADIPFLIYILPGDSTIKYDESKDVDSNPVSFTDYFNNPSLGYQSTPTKTTKFLSYYDKAFTINCIQDADFYKNLGIGAASFKKIFTNKTQTFTIDHLDWTFIDNANSHSKFNETKNGILAQLYANYIVTKNKSQDNLDGFKIICVQVNKEKQELLIDENLTMPKMEKMFSNIKKIDDIPKFCFDILIYKSGQNKIWTVYLHVLRNFITGQKTPKNYLLSYFNKILRQKITDWVKSRDKSEPKQFFIKSNFCLQCLCTADYVVTNMDKNEEFAERLGQIANVYVEFKRKEENNNSLIDILTYPKYDREKLRFIFSRICHGLQSSRLSDVDKNDVTNQIRSLQPAEEIDDDAASKDYSYFFFKGFYTDEKLK